MAHLRDRRVGFTVLLVVVGGLGSLTGCRAAPAEENVPLFDLRVQVSAPGGANPAPPRIQLKMAAATATITPGAWSDWISFTSEDAAAGLKRYPNASLHGFPFVIMVLLNGVRGATNLDGQLRLKETGEVVALHAELFGPRLGILLWRDEGGRPHAGTMADYNRRYWTSLGDRALPPAARPRLFPIVDRFIGNDDDAIDWQEGMAGLSQAGIDVLMAPPLAPVRQALLAAGLKRTATAVYSPPGYAFALDPKITPQSIQTWAAGQAASFQKAGYEPQDVAFFAMSDEPGWYYPTMLKTLMGSPIGMDRFHQYLRDQGLNPGDLGAARWEDVNPIGQSRAVDLPARRLFYWTMRFFSWDSENHFANCTRALEAAFYPNMPIATNWNFFSGRFYVPGPVANNPDKNDPDAAMGGHDWMEFGRLRGCTDLWTEDWFGDAYAYQWSFYASKLRSAAAEGGVNFGGYIVPRASGARRDGLMQKTLCLLGNGAKALYYYVFGPEYNFPGNCYSDANPGALRDIAQVNGMIAKAEDLLWPGRPDRSPVAILVPRSSEVWDLGYERTPQKISDATNANQNGQTVGYMAEVYDLYLALQHANIPCEMLDEDNLTAAGLRPYRVVYVTEPDIPVEGQQALADWVQAGGALATVAGAGAGDRYDQPSSTLYRLAGLAPEPPSRFPVPSLAALKPLGTATGAGGRATAIGRRETLQGPAGRVLASFEDGSPAIVVAAVGRGRVYHYAWMPGLSYVKSSTRTVDGLPEDFSATIRGCILEPVNEVRQSLPAHCSQEMVETPVLYSNNGAAVTLLNWTGAPLAQVRMTVQVPFRAGSVDAVEQGPLRFTQAGNTVSFSLPLNSADIVLIRS